MKNSILKPTLLLFLVISLLFSGCSPKTLTTAGKANAEFDKFTDELFVREVSGNTLNLHYTLSDPESFGIKEYPLTLGHYSLAAMEESMTAAANCLSAMESFPYDSLSDDRQLTYDCIYETLKTELQAKDLLSYRESLSAVTGFQAQLPVLLAEYTFHDRQDVEDYLALLAQVQPYFRQILAFEQEKAAKGLFMPAYAVEDIIDQCSSLIADQEDHFLISSFENRLDGLSLSEEEKSGYIARNRQTLQLQFFPAYEELIEGLSALKDQGRNPYGLCYFPEGRQYYSYLVASGTGSSFSVDELNGQILSSLSEAENAFSKTLSRLSVPSPGPESAGSASPSEESGSSGAPAVPTAQLTTPSAAETLSAESSAGALSAASVNPKEYLTDLQEKISEDFPSIFQVSYTLHDVDSSLEAYLSPAFYLKPPLDNPQNNVIYVNRAHNYTPLSLYTTLAHEGFPGHLYQNAYTRTLNLNKIRALFGTTGYGEGWATYAEMLSYRYADADPDISDLYRLNNQISLGVSAALDIGIHYNYWTPDDAYDFLNTYGFADRASSDALYQYIVEEPANYLNYYVGYLEFMRLRDLAEETQGKNFQLKKFHKTLLDIGEAPFSVVEKYLKKAI